MTSAGPSNFKCLADGGAGHGVLFANEEKPRNATSGNGSSDGEFSASRGQPDEWSAMKTDGIQKTVARDDRIMNGDCTRTSLGKAYALLVRYAGMLQSPLLLVIRLWWGWSFFLTGKGKLVNHAGTSDFFQSLGIPMPGLNAWIAGGVECIGGLCLLVGFASRLSAIPLSITMIVAYLTADNEALKSIFSDTDKFTSAAPFLFLLTALLVLAFGPGVFSVDHLLARKFSQTPMNAKDGRRD